MGQAPSLSPEEQFANDLRYADALLNSDHWQGFGVDRSLQQFSGLNSTEELNYYRDQVLYNDGVIFASSVVAKLGPALGHFTVVPHAVGLGALVISIILEAVGRSLDKETLGTAGMLDRVFAQEKAREVRDQMEEYLKRLHINMGHKQRLLTETRQIEGDLSIQLTRLKNSMLRDGHLNTQSLKQWVNGAAFHTQMLIHEARLKRTAGSRALRAAGIYQQQLNTLLDKYKTFLPTVIEVHRGETIKCYKACFTAPSEDCLIKYTENQRSTPIPQVFERDRDCVKGERIANAMFSRPQLDWARTYFSDLQANIPTLVRQCGSFHV